MSTTNSNNTLVIATGENLKGAHVPLALISKHVNRMTATDLGIPRRLSCPSCTGSRSTESQASPRKSWKLPTTLLLPTSKGLMLSSCLLLLLLALPRVQCIEVTDRRGEEGWRIIIIIIRRRMAGQENNNINY